MRPGPLVAVAVAAASLGGASALLLGKAVGWVDASPSTVTIAASAPTSTAATTGPASSPALAARFDPAAVYTLRSPGVVTIYAYYGAQGAETSSAQGSGFVVSGGGTILTNAHVITNAGDGGPVQRATRVYVEFQDLDRVPGRIVGWDLFDDVGVLKVDPNAHALAPLPLGDSSRVAVGEPVAAIGSPFGNQNSLAVGVVSATGRSIPSLTGTYEIADAIQIDAPINHGNSGGPLLDATGRVIGINAQIKSDSGNAEGVGFAVPVNAAKRSMEQLIATGRVAYAYVGVSTENVTPSLARQFGLGADRGALIAEVRPGSPAAAAGLRGSTRREIYNGITVSLGGDLVVAVDGSEVKSATDFVRLVAERYLPGQTASLTILRGGTARTVVRVTFGARTETDG